MTRFNIFNPTPPNGKKEPHPPTSPKPQNNQSRRPFIVFANDPDLRIKKVGGKNRGELSGEVIHTESPHSPKSTR